ncbi:carbohydrate-binding module family 48 protein [Aplosporella prunicola CBS 121167]|uniref:Carbohydrate-binding module family 48 protein n=1 Tax=Aplosporella prunicola CBS 121167 TaxID=1176127 RepID=A0A6A6B5P5_9PEZI|nr:carbohydrate-binding module family 48 protein [Aplosporella prunicola CBS 121167]KAF2138564.1 carbohydrate-binding module family 48 protein [Aplosporella prunicola CBS 121167]
MGSYTFKWEHPASDVYVTGTFDDWAKSVRLVQKNGVFTKTVELPKSDEKVLYKFVVDGNWVTNGSAPQEDDGHGIYNNVLHPTDIHPSHNPHIMSSAAPEATTAELAGEQPKETPSDIPGAFLETPADELQQFSVNPIPASEGDSNPVKLAPGEEVPHPSTINANTVDSTVKDDEELKAQDAEKEQAFGVSPLPGTNTAGNPISLAPGEKVPHHSEYTTNDVNSNVTLDKESYEKGASLPPQLGPVVTPDAERSAHMFDIPGLTNNMIPESSLPMGSAAGASAADPGVTVQSSHPESTTAALAGQVPKEPRGVPQVVSDSQEAAHVSPEAAANPEAVQEKSEVENELLNEVPEQPATSENNTAVETASEVAGVVAGGLATAGVAAAGAAAVAGEKAAETYQHSIAPTVQQAIDNMNAGGPADNLHELAEKASDSSAETASDVPKPVADSIAEAHASPEAAANPEAVSEKKDMESELLDKVPESNETGKPAPSSAVLPEADVPEVVAESIAQAHADPEAVTNPEAVADKHNMEEELLHSVPKDNATGEHAPAIAGTEAVPDVVKESIAQADQPAEAVTNPEAVQQKSAMENELAHTVQPTDEIADVAPTESAALTATAPEATTQSTHSPADADASALGPQSLTDGEPLKSSSEPEIPVTTISVAPTGQAEHATEPPATSTGTADPTTEENAAKTGLNAPAEQPAQSVATEAGQLAAQPDPEEQSRDVSPMSKPQTTEQTEPTVTTGTGETTAPATSGPDATTETPAGEAKTDGPPKSSGSADGSKSESDKAAAAAAEEEKKKKNTNRRSFFAKLKDKFTSHKA